MAEVFRKTTDWIAHGNTRVKFLVIADKSGDTVTWTATPSAAQTLCYKHKYLAPDQHSIWTYYVTYGENPIAFNLKLVAGSSSVSSASKTAVGSVSSGVKVSSSGWIAWGHASNTVAATSTGDYTGVSAYIITNGRGGQKSTSIGSGSGGSVTPSSDPSVNTKFGYAKIRQSWKRIIQGFTKVDGEWKGL